MQLFTPPPAWLTSASLLLPPTEENTNSVAKLIRPKLARREIFSGLGMTAPDQTEYVASLGGYCIYTACWRPRGEPKALVHIVHGYGEHLMHYDDVAPKLTEEGYLVFAHDHFGHGRSDGQKGDIIEYGDFIRDLLFLTGREAAAHPALPLFVLAHSFGGIVALHAALQQPSFTRGVLLLSPALTLSPETASPLRIFVGKWVASLWPQAIVLNLQSSRTTRNEAYLQKHRDDPLDFNFVRAKFGIQGLNAQIDLLNRLDEVTTPFLVLHGVEDAITDISGSRLLEQKASSEDKAIVEFPEALHQLHHELEDVTEETFQALFAWINDRL